MLKTRKTTLHPSYRGAVPPQDFATIRMHCGVPNPADTFTAPAAFPHISSRNLAKLSQNWASWVVAKLMRMRLLGARLAWNRAPGASR